MPRVFYIGSFRFPDGDAAAARVLGNGKALREAGYDVIFGGWEEAERPQDRTVDGRHEYQGFRYVAQDEFRRTSLGAVQRLARYFRSGGRTLAWLTGENLGHGDVVIAYQTHSTFLARLMFLCRRRGARLIGDCTEWYDPSHVVGGRLGVVRWDEEVRMRVVNRAVGRLIVISSFLERYYRGAECRIARVPPLVDLGEAKWPAVRPRERDGSLRLVYAGSPGRKDLLGNVLRGLVELRARGRRVELDLLGPSREAVATALGQDQGVLHQLGEAVQYHGRVSQEEVPAWLAQADFSVLLRPHARYAEAGFPTKLVESLAAGVPVITNPTSDIGRIVEHGREGILLPGHSPGALAQGVEEILQMERHHWAEMRQRARQKAVSAFDYHRYVGQLGGFVGVHD